MPLGGRCHSCLIHTEEGGGQSGTEEPKEETCVSRMEVRAAPVVVLVLVLASVERCVSGRCFSRFNQGLCSGELGDVDEDDCCQNPLYGYAGPDGECRSCGPPVWSPWSPWSPCNTLCGDGVSQRTRTCFSISQSDCENADDVRQVQPCSGSCCDVKGWGQWQAWSSCSVTCGGGGVTKRRRVCADPPKCQAACSGPAEETADCLTSTCPVPGGWSSWSSWSQCSASCIFGAQEANVPTRRRSRSCSNPAPSADTTPPGAKCPGDEVQQQDCSDLPNCPEDGGWGAWKPAGACSTSCGEGLQLSIRRCDRPPPRFGGRLCEGPTTKAAACQAECPVDGFWSGWSSWGECSSSCIPQDRVPVKTRQRSCTNPAPSSRPPGRPCKGDRRQTQPCYHLPPCSVDGGWSAWSAFSSCPVTCGVGLQVSERKCDSPAPRHGGRPCPEEARRTVTCRTNVHCPVDGVWSPWSPWSDCRSPFRGRDIRCQQMRGSQKRSRECLHRAYNGSICGGGDHLSQTRICYDVQGCYFKGTWEGWDPWSSCRPSCGGGVSKRFRKRFCKPDYSKYNYQRFADPPAFFGTPTADCGATPDGGPKVEFQACANLPACS